MNVLMWEAFAPGAPIRVGGHHYAERFLLRGDRVAWLVGPLSPVNLVKRNDETRRRLRLYRRGGESLERGRLFAYSPMTLLPYRPYPLFDRPLMHRLTLRATVPRLGKVLARAGFERVDLLWMSTGSPFLALLDDVPHRFSIYRMSDDTAAFPDTPSSFAGLEREVCRRVDLVLATARTLEERARSLGARRVLYLPNACEPERFATGLEEPADLRGVPRPGRSTAGRSTAGSTPRCWERWRVSFRAGRSSCWARRAPIWERCAGCRTSVFSGRALTRSCRPTWAPPTPASCRSS